MKKKGGDFLKKLYCKCNKNNMVKAMLIFSTFIAGIYLLNMYNTKRLEGFTNEDFSALEWEHIEPGTDDKIMILAHWTDCGHCKKMLPDWVQFEQKYKGPLGVGRIESAKITPSMKEKYNISGYPTIILINKSTRALEGTYDGERTLSAFESYANSKASSS